MKGFEINYNGQITKVAVEDGMVTIILSSLNGSRDEDFISVTGVDYQRYVREVWLDHQSIKQGDSLQIKVSDIDNVSEPVKTTEDRQIKRPSKLEFFQRLEKELTEQGIL